MDVPRIPGFKVGTMVGHGESGRVYLARDLSGKLHIVKVFDALAIARTTLLVMTNRLMKGGWPEGVLPVEGAQFDERPAYWIAPFMGEVSDDGTAKPQSLQHTLAEHPGEHTWALVSEIAEALASMHRRRVAHANLKPGNVFLTDAGRVMLSDWAMGNMPGVGHTGFTDAVLYQPPEQLRSADGYLHEEAYRWDVYAFGSIAYRLLTGRFPRCNEIFETVAPEPGVTRNDDIHADLPRIAANIEREPDIVWPDEPISPLEAGLREWIERCLALDPHDRPASMTDVVHGFTRVEQDLLAHEERNRLLDQRRTAKRRAVHAYFAFGMAAAASFIIAAMWKQTVDRLDRVRADSRDAIANLEAEKSEAIDARTHAESAAIKAAETLEYERERALTRLQAARETGDQLFRWAIEQGHRRLPPLDGRNQRLGMLEAYFNEFLERTSSIEELANEHARARIQLAEIALAKSDATTAAERLSAVVDTPHAAQEPFRMARNMLLLALLQYHESLPESSDTFRQAREMLEAVPQSGVDNHWLRQMIAVVDFHQAKLHVAAGENALALERLMEATKSLNQIADERPDAAVLRSELAEGYLSSASVLEGMGDFGNAREARELAVSELRRLLKESPDDTKLMLELAGCIGSMAEAAVLSGDTPAAIVQSKQAMELLDTVITAQPDNYTAISRKAAQIGLQADVLRDQGKSEEAIERYDKGIHLLEAARAAEPKDGITTYRLALLTWQKARMIGFGGDREEEITMLSKAANLLEQLESSPHRGGPRPEQIELSSAYLAGDLAHAQQVAGDKPAALTAFTRAQHLWKRLSASQPEREEYLEGLSWCEQRLESLKQGRSQ